MNSKLAPGFRFLRGYRADFYNFLLDEWISLYNDQVIQNLERTGKNPRCMEDLGLPEVDKDSKI